MKKLVLVLVTLIVTAIFAGIFDTEVLGKAFTELPPLSKIANTVVHMTQGALVLLAILYEPKK